MPGRRRGAGPVAELELELKGGDVGAICRRPEPDEAARDYIHACEKLAKRLVR